MTTNHKIREAETGAVPSRLKDGVSPQHRTNAPQLSPGVILNEVKDLLFLPHPVVILSADFARRIPLPFLPRMREGFFASLRMTPKDSLGGVPQRQAKAALRMTTRCRD